MVVSSSSEPDINIHITGTTPPSTKRAPAKQKSKRTPSKKPRLAPLSTKSPDSRSKNTVTYDASRQPAPDVSFRHLFSFASQSDSQQREGKSAQNAQHSFAFLGENHGDDRREMVDADEESQFPCPKMGSFRVERRETHPETDNNHGIVDLPQISCPMSGGEPLDRCNRHRGIGDAAGRSQFMCPSNDIHFQEPQAEAERPRSSDILMIPEDIDDRPDELLRIATQFCRQKSVGELEEDWCAPGGVRETMRRDFKQKRQNVTRGRKLGSSRKK